MKKQEKLNSSKLKIIPFGWSGADWYEYYCL